MSKIHAEGITPPEFTMCGMAFDAHWTGDSDEVIVMAAPGELVTCADCRRAIDHARTFARYRAANQAAEERKS